MIKLAEKDGYTYILELHSKLNMDNALYTIWKERKNSREPIRAQWFGLKLIDDGFSLEESKSIVLALTREIFVFNRPLG